MKKISNAEILENISMEDLVMKINEDEYAYGYIFLKEETGKDDDFELQVFQNRFNKEEINLILKNAEEAYFPLQESHSYWSDHNSYKEAIEGFMDFWFLNKKATHSPSKSLI